MSRGLPIPDFVELTPSQISQLPILLIQRLPKAAQLYNIVQMCLQNKYKHPFKIVRYTGLDLSVSLLAACTVTKCRTYWCILAPIVSPTENTLAKIMSSFAKLLDWDRKISLNAVDSMIYEHLMNACGVPEGFTKVVPIEHGGQYTISMETALQLDLSLDEGLEIRPLTEVDLQMVFEHWIYARLNVPSTLEFIAEGAFNVGSAGLYLNGQLVCFGMNQFDGGIHLVHTLEQYRGRGYGKTLMRHLCHSTAAMLQQFPVVHVDDTNLLSQNLMKNVGFQHSHSITWLEYDN